MTWYKIFRFLALLSIITFQNLVLSSDITGSEVAFFSSTFALYTYLMQLLVLKSDQVKEELEGVGLVS